MKKRVLIICNDKHCSCFLELVKPSQAEELHCILSEKQMGEHSSDYADYDLCIIQAELGWSQRRYQDFYGFEVAKRLRRWGLLSHIYFVALSRKDFAASIAPEYALLAAQEFHHLCRLPLPSGRLSELSAGKMNPIQWEDIVGSLLSIRALVKTALHDLRNSLILPQEGRHATSPNAIEQAVQQHFSMLCALLGEQKTHLAEIKTRLENALLENARQENPISPQSIVDTFTAEIINCSPNDQESLTRAVPLPTPWKLLLVEDEQNVAEAFGEAFKRHNIRFETKSQGTEALEVLKADEGKNDFAVLLCDLRLKNPDSHLWQTHQGYDIINEIKDKHRNYLAFFVVTSAQRLLFQLTRNYQVNIHASHKSDVLSSDGAMNLYCQKLREAGDRMWLRARSRPKLGAWNQGNARFAKPLSEFYRDHLFALDYVSAEDKINQLALEYYHKTRSHRLKKGEMEFTVTLKPSSAVSEGDLLQKFRENILVGRRIALALCLKDGFSEEAIFNLMQPESRVENFDSSKKLLFNTSLALSFQKDLNGVDSSKTAYLHSRLLLEEIEWLSSALDIDFDLEKIFLNLADSQVIWGLVDDMRYSLKTSAKQFPEQLQKQWLQLEKKESRELEMSSISEIEEIFKLLKSLAEHNGMWRKFCVQIQEETERIHNPALKAFLQRLISGQR